MNRHREAMRLIAEARPSVLDEAPSRPVPSFPHQPMPMPTPPARRRSRRLLAAGLVPTAAAVVGVVVAVGSASNPPGQSPPTSSIAAPPPATARGLLLAAAEKTTTTPGTGDFWVTKVELHHVYDVGGYHVQGSSEMETWHPLRRGGDVTFVTRWLGAAPATDADKAAWRAAGSPAEWALTGPDGKQAHGRKLTAAPGKRDVSVMPGGDFAIGGTSLTYAQIQALPADPDKLKAYLIKLDDAAGRDGTWTPDQIARWRVEMLFSESWTLLSDLPVPDGVPAATYRMLAGLPGLTVDEHARDAKGRAGAAIGYAYRNADGSAVNTRLVIDPDSGSLLAWEQRSDATVFLSSRYSSTPPPRS